MKKGIKDFLTFEKRGQKGLFFLSVVLVIQLGILWLLNFYNPLQSTMPNLVLVDPGLLDSLDNRAQYSYASSVSEAFNDDVVTFHAYKKEVKRFKFNPNTISDEQWLSLGLNKGQVRILRKYITKGGKFTHAEDVLKFKFVNEEIWKELIPYIELEEAPQTAKYLAATKDTSRVYSENQAKIKAERLLAFKQTLSFDINTCSRWNLQQLDLIDSVSIDIIMRYKRKLGGFIHLSQLYEIEGVDTTNFGKLKQHLSLDLMSVKTININNCSVSQLNKHPYLNYSVAAALVNYRTAHGKYAQLSDLKKCIAMNDNLLKKISPYLRLNDD